MTFSDAVNAIVSVSSDKTEICPQDNVTFTCTVQSGGALVRRAEPFISEANEISLIRNRTENIATFTSRRVTFHVVLI